MGRWRFALIDAAWTLRVGTQLLESDEFSQTNIDRASDGLNGQVLLSASWSIDNILTLAISEGPTIEAHFSPRLPPDSDILWLLETDGIEAGFYCDGPLNYGVPER